MTLNKCILLPLSILFTRLYTVNMKHRKCELLASAKILHNRGVIFFGNNIVKCFNKTRRLPLHILLYCNISDSYNV